MSINNHTNVSFSSHRCPLFHFNTTCRTGLCTFSTSYTHCFFYHSITSMVNFGRCQRTSIFTYSAGNTSFFIDTCHSFCQYFVPLSNLILLCKFYQFHQHSEMPVLFVFASVLVPLPDDSSVLVTDPSLIFTTVMYYSRYIFIYGICQLCN